VLTPPPTASPASDRKSAPSLSRTSSPSGSPKTGTGGRKQGRLRLPQLGSRHRLSSSKENLDAQVSKEGAPANPEAPEDRAGSVPAVGSGSEAGPSPGLCGDRGAAAESSSGSHCEVPLANGEGGESTLELTSDCSTESNVDSESSLLQQGDTAMEAVYNLYAISVGVLHRHHPYTVTHTQPSIHSHHPCTAITHTPSPPIHRHHPYTAITHTPPSPIHRHQPYTAITHTPSSPIHHHHPYTVITIHTVF